MIAAETDTLIGEVRIDSALRTDQDGRSFWYQPVGVHLQNDGRWHHWMAPGHGYDYEIRHDGTGWQVTCAAWSSIAGHTYRLARLDTGLVDRLPLDDGEAVLTPGRTYALREVGERTWSLYELA